MLTRTETIDGASYTFTYAYDTYGRVTDITYPDGLKIKQNWTGNYLKSIVDVATSVNLLKDVMYSPRNQIKTYTQGNGNSVTNVYNDTYGYMETQTFGPTAARLKYTYTFDAATQNLTARSLTNLATNAVQTENFSYDRLDRLAAWTVTNSFGTNTRTTGYQANGNITQKDQMGFYIYGGSKPHAVTSIAELSGTAVTSRDCNITYNSFNKVDALTYKVGTSTYVTSIFTYGPDNQRRLMTTSQGNTTKTLYTGLYQVNNGTERLHYISGPAGLAALIVTNSGNTTRTTYYLQTDYQGSLIAVYNSNGTLNKQFSYDPWGHRRHAANWNDYAVSAETLFTRGYTGHEHLDDFGLINMNGRVGVYPASFCGNPRLARFLSPDNYVQAPTNTQSFNRYSYCLNNPMKYTDPTGYKWKWWQKFLLGDILTAGAHSIAATSNMGLMISTAYVNSVVLTMVNGFSNDDRYFHTGEIFKGLFKTDPNLSNIDRIKQFVSRFTWEAPQTQAGYTYSQLRNATGGVDRVDYLGGATYCTNENSGYDDGGVSLGNYINICIDEEIKVDFTDYAITHPTYMHEYGHTFDSQKYGISYLLCIGIPSLRSAKNSQPDYTTGGTTHRKFWTERNANKYAADYFGKYYGVDWSIFEVYYGKYGYYPRN